MGLFRKNMDEQRKLRDLIHENSLQINEIAAQIGILDQKIKNLRGLVNRKLGNFEDNDNQTEKSKYSDPFDSIRKNGIF